MPFELPTVEQAISQPSSRMTALLSCPTRVVAWASIGLYYPALLPIPLSAWHGFRGLQTSPSAFKENRLASREARPYRQPGKLVTFVQATSGTRPLMKPWEHSGRLWSPHSLKTFMAKRSWMATDTVASTWVTRQYWAPSRCSIYVHSKWSLSRSGTRASNGGAGGVTWTILAHVSFMPPGRGRQLNRLGRRWCWTPHSDLQRV